MHRLIIPCVHMVLIDGWEYCEHPEVRVGGRPFCRPDLRLVSASCPLRHPGHVDHPARPCQSCRHCELDAFLDKGMGFCRTEWACGPGNEFVEYKPKALKKQS